MRFGVNAVLSAALLTACSTGSSDEPPPSPPIHLTIIHTPTPTPTRSIPDLVPDRDDELTCEDLADQDATDTDPACWDYTDEGDN